MLSLITPDATRYDDWKAACDEFGATPKDGTGFSPDAVVDTSRDGFDAYLADRARQRETSVTPPEGFVHCTYFWVLDDEDLVGFLALRHGLTPRLFTVGGHIGYSVRPNARGGGVATGALKLGLGEAARLGLLNVLVTSNVDNDASRAVIEKCGGQFEDMRLPPDFPGLSRRYWFGSLPWPQGPTA